MLNLLYQLDWQLTVTIILALLAGIITLRQVKGNIISSARIKWIEELRETCSTYISEIFKQILLLDNLRFAQGQLKKKEIAPNEDLNFIEKHHNPYNECVNNLNKLKFKILLYIDAENIEQKKIESIIQEINDLLSPDLKDPNILNNEEFNIQIDNKIIKLMDAIRKVFKIEYDKSKNIWKL